MTNGTSTKTKCNLTSGSSGSLVNAIPTGGSGQSNVKAWGNGSWYDESASIPSVSLELKRSHGLERCSKCGTTIPKGFPYLVSERSMTHWCHLCFKDLNDCLALLLEQIPSETQEDYIAERFVKAL